MAKELAMDRWSSELIDKINTSKSSKDVWNTFKKMTRKKDCNTVLPLIDGNEETAFSNQEKCKLLQSTFFEGNHLKKEEFDDQFYQETTAEYDRICIEEDKETTKNKLDYEITTEEVEAAIYLLEIGKSPGADDHFPELFKFAGENFIEALRLVINQSWEQGKLPQEWKTANIKFLRKHGKTNYYSPSSYRPISLTSVVCKIMERVILNRLSSYVEGMRLIEDKQEGFRKKHSTSNCLMRLIQDIIGNFNKGKTTIACLIDQEKAYDSVWREGLLVKLYNLGIRGKTWSWIKNFLKNRTARCTFDDYVGEEFESKLGLPQGSVLAPTLFNIFINDLLADTSGDYTKFADDSTIWNSDNPTNIEELFPREGQRLSHSNA